jgi:hypothetical protein
MEPAELRPRTGSPRAMFLALSLPARTPRCPTRIRDGASPVSAGLAVSLGTCARRNQGITIGSGIIVNVLSRKPSSESDEDFCETAVRVDCQELEGPKHGETHGDVSSALAGSDKAQGLSTRGHVAASALTDVVNTGFASVVLAFGHALQGLAQAACGTTAARTSSLGRGTAPGRWRLGR